MSASLPLTLLRSAVSSSFRRYLLATNVTLSVGLSGLGDLLQQQRSEGFSGPGDCDDDDPHPVHRTGGRRAAHMALAFGATSGVLCHYWYLWLDAFLPGAALRVVGKKILLDQLLFSPVCIAACLGASCVLDGSSVRQMREEILQKGSRLYLAEWALWPPAQFVNFYFLPTRFRVLFDSLVSLVYDVYASHVKHQIRTGPTPRTAALE